MYKVILGTNVCLTVTLMDFLQSVTEPEAGPTVAQLFF